MIRIVKCHLVLHTLVIEESVRLIQFKPMCYFFQFGVLSEEDVAGYDRAVDGSVWPGCGYAAVVIWVFKGEVPECQCVRK